MRRIRPNTSGDVHGEQLAMFMTPREIKSKYGVWEADRESAYDFDTGEESLESDEQVWDRKLDESQLPPGEYTQLHGGGSGVPDRPTFDDVLGRGDHPVEFPSAPRRDSTTGWAHFEAREDSALNRLESWVGHQQSAWDRKYDPEATGPSLYDKVAAEGVQKPVHLGTGAPRDFGQKPQVFGGHHRIAAMGHINQDQLMPVLHHADYAAARNSPERPPSPFKYT